MKSLLLLACLLSSALAQVDLSSYPLSAVLRDRDGEVYTLHWGFDVEAQTIRFAVNVSTTGWVGLGLSPTGGMPNSDVVIGWVNDGGQAFLQDRYATAQSRPPVDAQQDWFLDGGMEMDGFTILAFRRDWVTCDELDREIKTDTARLIYAWNEADPAGDDPNEVMYHGNANRGTQSLNLLGGQQVVLPDPADLESFDVIVNNVNVPSSDTTYWCYVVEIPQSIQNQTRYITKVAPVINPNDGTHVHHLLIYECDSLDSSHVGYSASCGSGTAGAAVASCLQDTLLAGWAVGGEEFVYPADVAYPIGGPGAPRYLVMQTHYDNPGRRSDIVDNSGMRFFYTSTARRYDSGILQMGHRVSQYMIIPPGASDFVVQGECSSECTASQIPKGGINVFANILHTHLAGVGLTVHHLRRNQSCSQNDYEELIPIDQNLQYDFNYQQANHLPALVNIQPGDIIRLECNYNTVGRSGVALGGESTEEEMCLTFLFYYPRINLAACLTGTPATTGSFEPFLTDYVTEEQRNTLLLAVQSGSRSEFQTALNQITWSSQAIDSFQSSVVDGLYTDACIVHDAPSSVVNHNTGLPAIQCSYEAPDPCSSTTPMPTSDSTTASEVSITTQGSTTVQGGSTSQGGSTTQGGTTTEQGDTTPGPVDRIDLSSYPLSAVLRDRDSEVYTLHWGFDVEAQTIRFAVNVSTTGWVGLGLSPTGGMPNSDVVIGWVNQGGQAFLQDRYAYEMSRPSVDAQQDWFLDGGMEIDGFTILAFRRDWVTCDELDREINTDTARVIYAWNEADPDGDDPSEVMYHGNLNRGAQSLNLLGGQQEVPPDPADLQSFDVVVDQVNVPSADTTYWCYVEKIPSSILAQTRYITKIAPVINPADGSHVHHMLIYECDTLDDSYIGYSASCGAGGTVVSQCLQGTLIAAWAVGGEEFVYPADVAYPIGGPGAPRYLVMQVHYDNPGRRADTVDSSGMRFSYTSTARRYDSGILEVGHRVSPYMIIPPGASDFVVQGECSSECTASQIPVNGINIFANILHTHLVGIGLTLRHIRRTPSCLNGYEEVKPIDQNLQYDFNYQQANHFPELINIRRGDVLRLQCNYNTVGKNSVVLGGESTEEEMCLSFLFYYPRIDLAACLTSTPVTAGSYQPFLTDYVTEQQRNEISEAVISRNLARFEDALNQIAWSSPGAVDSFQSSAINGPYTDTCIVQNVPDESVVHDTGLPEVQCPYTAPDPCSDSSPDPGDDTSDPGDGTTLGVGDGAVQVTSSFLILTSALLMALAVLRL